VVETLDESRPRDILTVDYEDWFHVGDPAVLPPDTWDRLPLTVQGDTLRLLDLLDEHAATATFFVVGWLAERTPDVVREVARRGHRLALHGYHHQPPNRMSESEFREDVRRCVDVIGEITGQAAEGFRAPFFGVRDCRYPYTDVLRGCGLRYDASVFPGFLPGRGQPGATAVPHELEHRGPAFWEIPVSVTRLFGVPVAYSGGGFLRLLPAWFVRLCTSRAANRGVPVVYYLHPRDLNPEGPTVPVGRWRRARHYGGRRSVAGKIETALRSSRLTSVEEFVARAVRLAPRAAPSVEIPVRKAGAVP
jgi:polysaccharide deacetylase family protein (PEP-CTERM system associated)